MSGNNDNISIYQFLRGNEMKLLVIDGNSIMNRAFYGIRTLTNSEGVNTNALYGFLTTLHRHLKEEGECRVAAAFDLKAPTYRHGLYKDYKAGRKPMPEELREQFPIIKQMLDALGVTRIEREGLEADDIIGILSRECSDANEKCVIITGDRDAFQLADKNVTVKLATSKQGGTLDEIYTPAAIKEKYGLAVSQLIDLKALMGDASDNIPGVPGVGEKTAEALLKEYGTLEGVYDNIESIKGALKSKLENGKESAFMSRELGRIVRKSDLLDVTEKDILPPKMNESEFLSLLLKYDLKRIIKLYGLDESSAPAPTEKKEKNRASEVSVSAVSDASCLSTERLFVVCDGDTLAVRTNEGVSLVGLNGETLKALNGKRLVTHDGKPLLKRLLSEGYSATLEFDTMLAGYILDPSQAEYPLSKIIEESSSVSALTPAEQCYYLPEAEGYLETRLEQNGQTSLFGSIELPLCNVLANMEHDGFEVNAEFLKTFGEKLEGEINDCTQAIYLYAGHEFNINSTKQLATVLFDEMCLPYPKGKKTKTGYSTANDILEKLRETCEDPIVENVIEYRKLSKLKSTYIDGLLKKIGDDGRIHTVFTQTVTQTGRISSTEPNLQNIPVRTELGRQLRKAFKAKDGYILIDADYSQIELRVLAHIANDENMKRAFIENRDIHTATAAQVFGLPEAMVTPELRRRAKAVNFGIVYGIGEYSLSQDIGVSFKEAKNYIENYFRTYSGVKSYMEGIIESAKEKGYVETMFGRRRYVPDINAKNRQLQAFASRVCRNTPIQGTAADLIKLAMVRVFDRLERSEIDARLILQIHDELIIEAPEDRKDEICDMLKYEMEHAAELSVPLLVDVNSGKTWYESK